MMFWDRKSRIIATKKWLSFLSPLVILGIFFYVFRLFQLYDWNQAFTKCICFGILLGMISLMTRPLRVSLPRPVFIWLEIVILASVVIIASWHYSHYVSSITTRSNIDIETQIEKSAYSLFQNHQNPYLLKDINPNAEDAPYNGFHYGPFMLAGYVACIISNAHGYKITSLVFFVLSLLITFSLCRRKGEPLSNNLASWLFILAAVLLPERMWYELLTQGANDIFPAFLILVGIFFLRHRFFFLTGLAVGLAFSAKFVPAGLFILLCFRRQFLKTLFAGVLVGLIPIAIFLVWDSRSLIGHCFIYHEAKAFDSTSLYAITPAQVRWIFPAFQLLATVIFIRRNFDRPLEYRSLTVQFLSLSLIVELLYRQVHCNHLVLFIPFLALVMAWYRYGFLTACHDLSCPTSNKLRP